MTRQNRNRFIIEKASHYIMSSNQAAAATTADQAKMEKYRKVRSERDAVPDGIIRVNRNIQARVFIDQVLEEFNTKNKDTVTLSSLGEAITKSVTIAEIVKHRVAGLHQINEISTIVIDDEYEPIEEGLDKMTVSRKLTCLQITLSKKKPGNAAVAGY